MDMNNVLNLNAKYDRNQCQNTMLRCLDRLNSGTLGLTSIQRERKLHSTTLVTLEKWMKNISICMLVSSI